MAAAAVMLVALSFLLLNACGNQVNAARSRSSSGTGNLLSPPPPSPASPPPPSPSPPSLRSIISSWAFQGSRWLSPVEGGFMLRPSLSLSMVASIVNITGQNSSLYLYNYPRGFDGNVGGLFTLNVSLNGFTFQAASTSECMDKDSSPISTQVIISQCKPAKPSQQFFPIFGRSNDSAIQWLHTDSGLCLDGGSGLNGSLLLLNPCKSYNNSRISSQLWSVVEPSSTFQTSPTGLTILDGSSNVKSKLNKFFRHASWIANLPLSVDWRPHFVCPKDQLACGCCSVFGATATIEHVYNLYNQTVVSLSEQKLLDCAGSCSGTWPVKIFNSIANDPLGLPITSAYGAYAGTQNTCQASGSVQVLGYEQVPPFNTQWLQAAVSQQAVLTSMIYTEEFALWNSCAIYTDPNKLCVPGGLLSHVVTLVGYGTASVDYWIIRNSFGPTWGCQGYAFIQRDICGINTLPSLYPVLATPANSNPCSPINPCGRGSCTATGSMVFKYKCSCPPGFVAANNTDGTQACTIVDVCGNAVLSPCGAGTCVSEGNGNYHCVCFSGYTQTLDAEGTPVCAMQSSASVTRTYVAQRGDFCYLIANAYGLTLSTLISMNPRPGGSLCPPAPGDTLNVTSSSGFICKVFYTVQNGDTCDQIASLMNLGATFQNSLNTTLNPGLRCAAGRTQDNLTSGLVPGQQICLALGIPDTKKNCIAVDSVRSTDISSPNGACAPILSRNPQISAPDFFEVNQGINCKSLFINQQVCVAYQTLPPLGCPGPYYIWQKGDTCSSVLSKFCGSRSGMTWAQCMGPNAGLCIGTASAWSPGRIICLPDCYNNANARVSYCYG